MCSAGGDGRGTVPAVPDPSRPLHLASILESLTEVVGDDPAVVQGARRYSWRQFDDEAARFAAYLHGMGIGHNAKVALFLYNSIEYLTAQQGVFKVRAVPINVNYRYMDDELAYILTDSDAEVVVYHASLADRVERARPRLTNVRSFVEVEDRGSSRTAGTGTTTSVLGAVRYVDVVAAHAPAPRLGRSPDDLYMLYTGGTTGRPKGVMFRMGDFVQRLFTGYVYRGWQPPTDAASVLSRSLEMRTAGHRRVAIPACPLMHGTGLWIGVFYVQLMGGTAVLLEGRRFDADELWRVASAERADAIAIVGDAFARPMLDALDVAAAAGRPYRLDDMRIIMSSGVIWSAEVQQGMLRHLDVRLVDSMGSTEGGMARRIATRSASISTAVFELLPSTRVVTDDGRFVEPGSGEIGRVAAGAFVPIGYYKDPEKSAQAFPTIDGKRYTLAGDYASINADGTIVLLGRGSNCINTGGEKVFPEEVEEALKVHPAVEDCLVVGIPDEKFGEIVAAVVSLRPGNEHVHRDEIIRDARERLAGYKLPRVVQVVERVERAANGKADYPWAKGVALRVR